MQKLTANQIQKLTEKILAQWKSQGLITLKTEGKNVLQVMKDVVLADLKKEETLEKEVLTMLDTMEKEHGTGFQKGKMFNMLKQKLAKEKKIIL